MYSVPDGHGHSLAEHPITAHFERFNIHSPETHYTEYAPEPMQAPAMPDIHTYRQLFTFVAYYTGCSAEGEAETSPDICWVLRDYDDEEKQRNCVEEALKLINALKTSYNNRVASEGCFHPNCYMNRSNGHTPNLGAPNPYRPHEVLCLSRVHVRSEAARHSILARLSRTKRTSALPQECNLTRPNTSSR